MSKNLYRFAVLVGSRSAMARQVAKANGLLDPRPRMETVSALAAWERGELIHQGGDTSRELDQIIDESLQDYPNESLTFYRSVMDAWNTTHALLLPWANRHRPDAELDWFAFIHRNCVFIERPTTTFSGLLPPPTEREIAAIAQNLHPSEDATKVFLLTLFEFLRWCELVDGVGVITVRCLGPSQGDSEIITNPLIGQS